MKRLFGTFIDIRKGEGTLAFLMFLYYYLLLVTIYFLKPARDSLFLVRLGPAQLPLTFILIALVVLPVTTVYARLAPSFSITRLVNNTTAVLIVNLFILRGLIDLDRTWVYYLFYIWVSIYGVLVVSQFWLLANSLFNPPQAKRLFPLLNVGGILGAMTGGELTDFAIQRIGLSTENLLFFCIAFLSLCIVLLNLICSIGCVGTEEAPARPRREEPGRDTFGRMIDTVRRSRSLVFIVGLISIMTIVASFVDFQFKSISVDAFPEEADLTSFLGKFYGRISLVALVVQMLLSARILRALGVGGTLLFLPLSLLAGSVMFFILPALWTGVLLRGADQSFRYSLQKTAQELLFLPVPLDVKKRTKAFVDVFVDQAAQGTGGVLLLLSTLVFGLSLRTLSFVTVGLTAGWIVLAVRAHRAYVNAFRKALERREIDLEALDINIEESSTLDTLEAALSSRNERQVLYALDMLASVQRVDLSAALRKLFTHPSMEVRRKRKLFTHPSMEVRRKALYVADASKQPVAAEDLQPLLYGDDPAVRVAAMGVLCHRNSEPLTLLTAYLHDSDLNIQTAAIACIAEQDDARAHNLVTEQVVRSLLERGGGAGETLRGQMARALGALKSPLLQPYLRRLMNDPSPAVARNAIEGAGATRDPQLIPLLIDKLAKHAYRAGARDALAAFGAETLAPLRDTLTDERAGMIVRLNIPRVLRRIPLQDSVDILLAALGQVDAALKYPIIKALNKLRNHAALRIDEEIVSAALIEETREYYERLAILHLEWDETQAAALLRRSLGDRQRRGMELIFRLLGLQYPPRDIHNAYAGIVGRNGALRASAVEFLDNVLRHNVKRYLLPALDPVSEQETIARGCELFGYRLEDREQALLCLIRGRDAWLRVCAIANVTGVESSGLLHRVEEARYDASGMVRETSRMVLRNVQPARIV